MSFLIELSHLRLGFVSLMLLDGILKYLCCFQAEIEGDDILANSKIKLPEI